MLEMWQIDSTEIYKPTAKRVHHQPSTGSDAYTFTYIENPMFIFD